MITNLTRTFTPWLVGWLVGWLSTLGITVTDDQRLAIIAAIGTGAAWAYHTIAHVLERRWPRLSLLLGSTKQPPYTAPTTPTPPQ